MLAINSGHSVSDGLSSEKGEWAAPECRDANWRLQPGRDVCACEHGPGATLDEPRLAISPIQGCFSFSAARSPAAFASASHM